MACDTEGSDVLRARVHTDAMPLDEVKAGFHRFLQVHLWDNQLFFSIVHCWSEMIGLPQFRTLYGNSCYVMHTNMCRWYP
jgi:hypothetical protein